MTGNALKTGLPPATAQMMIVNPLPRGGIACPFSLHPSTAARVERLRATTPG